MAHGLQLSRTTPFSKMSANRIFIFFLNIWRVEHLLWGFEAARDPFSQNLNLAEQRPFPIWPKGYAVARRNQCSWLNHSLRVANFVSSPPHSSTMILQRHCPLSVPSQDPGVHVHPHHQTCRALPTSGSDRCTNCRDGGYKLSTTSVQATPMLFVSARVSTRVYITQHAILCCGGLSALARCNRILPELLWEEARLLRTPGPQAFIAFIPIIRGSGVCWSSTITTHHPGISTPFIVISITM